MALSIEDEEADRLARELARLTGESLTEAVRTSLRERLERQRVAHDKRPLRDRLLRIAQRYRARPLLDDRDADTILGYDDSGLPS